MLSTRHSKSHNNLKQLLNMISAHRELMDISLRFLLVLIGNLKYINRHTRYKMKQCQCLCWARVNYGPSTASEMEGHQKLMPSEGINKEGLLMMEMDFIKSTLI